MGSGFATYLTIAVVITGLLFLINIFLVKKNSQSRIFKFFDYARSLFPMLLLVWIIRSFIFQPYHVPTGSLEPTVLPGDFIFVKQYAYGLHFPMGNKKMMSVAEPKRGDIVLFYYPVDPSVIFVKRVIGLPGDHIEYKNKILKINGKMEQQTFLGQTYDYGDVANEMPPVNYLVENLNGIKHGIFVYPTGGEDKIIDAVVPKNQYFVMGDNRDNSEDSRAWGFVPANNLIGKAGFIFLSWDNIGHSIRWNRIGRKL